MVSPIVIAGPTGSGKSAYALKLAAQVGGEIVCADSRQVYQGMVIGTASPSDEEKALVAHHNYNVIDPHDRYDAGRFVSDTDRVVTEISARGRVPILVGGTGLYLRCYRFGLSDVPESDPMLRKALQARLEREGASALYEELCALDAETAQKISPNDAFRILRALEIITLSQNKVSTLRKSHFDAPRAEAQWLLLHPERKALNQALLARTEQMFKDGLVEEAVALRERLSDPEHALLQTIGYQESLAYVDGICTVDEAIERTFIRTRQYAKRQTTWFQKESWWTRVG